MLMAVAGAVGAAEYLDAALVVTLFASAELVEAAVMEYVRDALKMSTGNAPSSANLQVSLCFKGGMSYRYGYISIL